MIASVDWFVFQQIRKYVLALTGCICFFKLEEDFDFDLDVHTIYQSQVLNVCTQHFLDGERRPLSLCLSVSLSLCLSVSLSLCLSVSLSLCLTVSQSLCPSVPLSLCPSVPLSLCLSVSLSLCLFASLSLCLAFYLPVYLSNLTTCLSVSYLPKTDPKWTPFL